MSYEDFLDITPKELFDAVVDKERYDAAKVKVTIRAICETIRKQTLLLINIQLKKKDRIRNEKQLMGFSWDNENLMGPQTKEEMVMTAKMIASSPGFKKKK